MDEIRGETRIFEEVCQAHIDEKTRGFNKEARYLRKFYQILCPI